MECNKDEALRAIEIAEKKFAIQDYTTAKKLLLKAQQLYPTFENISRMLAVVEVHTIAQGKAFGTEIDWYQLLQVDSTAADSIIKKNYRKLVLMLHPDKNKSPGAEAAFKLVGEAWAVLSDKTKRSIYDTKRVLSGKDSKLTEALKKEGCANSTWSQSQANKNSTGTFWTVCPHCKMRYEYYRTYLNFNLKCQKCLKIFVANDIYGVSENGMNRSCGWQSSRPNAGAQQAPPFKSQQGQNVHVGENLPRSGTVPAAAKSTVPNAATERENISKVNTSTDGVNKSQTVFEEVKVNSGVARQKRSKNTKQYVDRVDKKIKEVEEMLKGIAKKQQTLDALFMKRKKNEEESAADRKDEDPPNLKRMKKATHSGNQDGQGQDEKHKKPNTHDAAVDSESQRSCRTRRDVDYNFDCAEDEDLVPFPHSNKRDKIDLNPTAKSQKVSTPRNVVHQNLRRKHNTDDQRGLPVPDADFYSFDQDRMEKSFNVGQIWAIYDDVNGMPRYYCRIMKVLTTAKFGVHIKWLEALSSSKNNSGKISGLSAACGEFKYAKQLRTEKEINLFSHVMRVEVADEAPVKIYPKSGEVWALFRDWDKEEFRSSRIDHSKNWKYELVEVLTEFDMGVNIASLVKLDGYKTVFTRQVNAGFKWFPSTELSRFSHMVPSWKIVGKGSVDGSWDLDPVSLPWEIWS